ncbi:hypothetical protein [Methylobacterium symbioticum]|uniref:Lipocalin-like domain-containing protein n=1 Tax=Methylobacterium symbioticum TaxID=2584084 RepID=A0A509EA26_9HYPH|nr:hypothetical protein [Methylobacterium symbioticum]VUD71051.1 hypothetical protein MET9862_01625 [Methylobacterium symbioticum]
MTSTITALTLAAGLALPILLPAGPAQAGDFNGTWRVELVTESGICDSRYNYAVFIAEGQMRLASATDSNARMSGRVGADGTVGLTVSNGSASGTASGRLQAQTGSGTWKVSALCSGRWTARRSNTRTAQAE